MRSTICLLLLTLSSPSLAQDEVPEPMPCEPGEVASEPAPPKPHVHGPGHFVEPERFVAAWNAPDRDAWQKPDEIVAALGLRHGSTVVDLGAGTGYLLPHLSRAVGRRGTVLAADLEPAMLAFLDEAARTEGWKNVRTHATSADDPRLAAGSVDALVTLNVWHHIEDRTAYARRLATALKPGGSVVIVDFLPEDTEGFGPPLSMRLSAEQVVQELTEGGLHAEVLPESLARHYIVRGVKTGR